MGAMRRYFATSLSVLGLFSVGVSACSDVNDPTPSTGSGGNPGGIAGHGGIMMTSGTASGETTQAAGTRNDGGTQTTAGSGGVAGSASGGGVGATGGRAGSSGTGGETRGGSGGSGGSGECVKGQTKGNQVAVIGESFIAATHGITQQIEKQAKANGSLAQNESYIDNSVSGTTLANDQIPSQYRKAADSGMIKYVLMDGGGNDCLQRNDGDGALAAAESLFETMTEDQVEKVVYFFYPDPIGSQYNSLKACLDELRPKMKALCDGLTSPKCYWLDLRTVWNGHGDYTGDGIHPTSAGSIATGDAVWEVMKANCVAQ
jgi:hypothetical protein